MKGALVVEVGDIVGHPEAKREVSGSVQVSLRLGDTYVKAPMSVVGAVSGTVEGALATFTASAPATCTCVRCLTEWEETIETTGAQHFGSVPDEDGYAIDDGTVDLAGPAIDELALALPSAPVCKPDCKGLCPTCGSDLNSDPCDGHGEDSDSPFAVLKDLLDP
ncbi:MAG: DUF177 domain-containing protein [Acidimicrobiia bacterium]|jgi:uncharacterized protein